MSMSEIILAAGGITGALTTIIAFVIMVLKPARKAFTRTFGSHNAQLAMLRNDITTIYYQYLYAKALPTYVRENLSLLNDAYVESGGNSYVCSIVKDMMEWDILEH